MRKLWTFFAYPDPETAVVDALQAAYLDSGGTLSTVLRALFLRDEFHSARARQEHVASPVEYLVGTVRSLQGRCDGRDLPYVAGGMGQDLFQPPNVAGWPGGLHWMTSVTRFNRFAFAWNLATARDRRYRGLYVPVSGILDGLPDGADGAAVVERVLEAAGAEGASAATRATLATYMETGEDGSPVPFDPSDPDAVDRKVRGLLGIVLMLPEASLA